MNLINDAWKFADEYNAKMQSASITAGENLRHPVVLIGLDCIRRYSQPGMFFCESNIQAIRAIKAEIQRNDAGLNIKRINICVLASEDCEETGQLLRKHFEEDFPVVHMSLFILLSESNLQEDFEARSAASLTLLKKVDSFQSKSPIYNLAWLLSDRNERGMVSEENEKKNFEIIAALLFLNPQDSHFEESIPTSFASAGMAHLTKPHREIAFSVYRRVFSWLLKFNKESSAVDVLEHPAVLAAVGLPPSEEKMAQDIESIAANNIKGRALHKKSIREAEEMLFGDRVRLFYEANFCHSVDMADFDVEAVMAAVREQIAQAGLSAAEAYRDNYLITAIKDIESRIAGYAQELELRYQSLYYHKTFQAIKRDAIVGIYVVRSQMERLMRLKNVMDIIQEALTAFCGRCEAFSRMLAEAEEALNAEAVPGLHISEYYEQAAERVMEEYVSKNGENFIGAIYPLLEEGRLSDKLADFINSKIMSHPSLTLSFEQDQEARAALSPDTYDRDFTNKNEFYSRLLEEADKQAALSVSLQRYDDLIFEKYYLGDTEGPCMAYAREHVNKKVNEAVYFMEDASGFKLLRLAGGFRPQDLARYRAMESYVLE